MNKKPLIGVSICAVVLLVLGSFTNVVGYQTIQSNQKEIKDEVDQKELLFQTIVDIANNKEIQRIILNSEMRREGFFNPGMRFSVFTPQVLTKNNLKHMYIIGLILSKTINKSKIHSMVKQYQLNNQGVQNDITAVIKKDAMLNGEITQLSNLKCDCENENTTQWSFPVLCTLLFPLFYLPLLIGVIFQENKILLEIALYFFNIIHELVLLLNCSWYPF
jgi:hypothetical protein